MSDSLLFQGLKSAESSGAAKLIGRSSSSAFAFAEKMLVNEELEGLWLEGVSLEELSPLDLRNHKDGFGTASRVERCELLGSGSSDLLWIGSWSW